MRSRTLFLGVSLGAIVALVIVGAVRTLDRVAPRAPAPAPTTAEAPQSTTKPVATTLVQPSDVPMTTPSAPLTADRVQDAGVTVPPSSRTESAAPAPPLREIAAPDAIDGGGVRLAAPNLTGSPMPPSNDTRSASPVAAFSGSTLIPSPKPAPPSGPSLPSRAPETQPRAANDETADRPTPTPPPSPAATNTRVWMVAEPAETVVGSALVLRVLIDGASDAASVPFHVVFNPAVLRFESGEEGSFLSGGGQTAFFASPTSTGERVVVGLSRLGGEQGVSGSGELCRLRFTAIGAGDSALAFDRAKVRGAGNKILPASFAPARALVR